MGGFDNVCFSIVLRNNDAKRALHFSVRYPEVVRLFTAIHFFLGKRLHSLERSPLFTVILDFLCPGKKPGRLSQPTHGVPPEGLFLFPIQSKGSACNDHHK